jgi:alkanesulfonate monooxygenase SsuD/methylene tetrahydromethanopterin reductase-like flavin-dependent oxidoreductase (luciferase family)
MAVGSVILAIVRGPVPMAKALAAVDILSNGRLFVGVAPGSSARDYEIVSINYDERWKRFDEAIQVLRSLWSGDRGFTDVLLDSGNRSRTQTIGNQVRRSGLAAGVQMPVAPGGATRDGWLASAYNTMPDQFARFAKLDQLKFRQRSGEAFPAGNHVHVHHGRQRRDRAGFD